MGIVLLKIVLAPILIALASLVGRRWGPSVSGWLVALPFTSGPVAFILALERGTSFATVTATGTLTATLSTTAFCLAYGSLAMLCAWPTALAGSLVVFAGSTLLLDWLAQPPVPLVLVAVVVALVVALRLMPRAGSASAAGHRPDGAALSGPEPWWDLPARMLVAGGFVLLLTGGAALLGPRLTGLLATFPLYASILASFAQHQQGPGAAVRVLRGLLAGLFGFAGFFVVLATLLVPAGIGAAFGAAIAVALAAQGVSLWALRRAR